MWKVAHMNSHQNPHQYEGSLAEDALYVAGVAGMITILFGTCFLILFLLRHEFPQGWSMAWEPALIGGVSFIVSVIAFFVWALDSYGYIEDFLNISGHREEPPNPFC